MEQTNIKFRTWYKGVPPRQTRLSLPGWAGHSNEHGDGAKAQPWHCTPFVEGASYGLELIYPFDTECRVTFDGEKMHFEGDFSNESAWDKDGKPPFMSFAPGHYGMTSSLDIQAPEGYIVRTEPHPRFYTDEVGDVPLAIVGHIKRFWPKIFFMVFKAPWPSQTHIFRKNEPYAQVLVLPERPNYHLEQMTIEEANAREMFDTKIGMARDQIVKHSWKAHNGDVFDDKYKVLSRMYDKQGEEGLKESVSQMASQISKCPMSRLIRKKKR